MLSSWQMMDGVKGLSWDKGYYDPCKFYCQLANGLIDNSFSDTTFRSRGHQDNTTGIATEKQLLDGIGLHSVPSTEKRKKIDGISTNTISEGRCGICKKNRKSKLFALLLT